MHNVCQTVYSQAWRDLHPGDACPSPSSLGPALEMSQCKVCKWANHRTIEQTSGWGQSTLQTSVPMHSLAPGSHPRPRCLLRRHEEGPAMWSARSGEASRVDTEKPSGPCDRPSSESRKQVLGSLPSCMIRLPAGYWKQALGRLPSHVTCLPVKVSISLPGKASLTYKKPSWGVENE